MDKILSVLQSKRAGRFAEISLIQLVVADGNQTASDRDSEGAARQNREPAHCLAVTGVTFN